jgi:glycosyltransferase involved in cell wall biosynthesis
MAEDVSKSYTAKTALASFILSETGTLLSQTRKWKPHIIHAHWWFPNGIAASTVSRLTDTPLVTTSHGTDLRLLQKTPAARPLARYVFDRSSAVTCVSGWLARQAAPLCRVVPTVAPMPVDVSIFAPSDSRELKRIVFVGRLSAQKGIEDAIRALAMMKVTATLDVVGDGPDRPRLAALANSLGLSARVNWRGQVAHDELPAILSRASALVAPFIDEGLGLVAAEAQLCETPPVVYASGGLTDVIADESTGLIVAPRDIAALAAALDRVTADPGLRASLGAAGRSSALAHFSPAASAVRYAGVYRDAAGH